MENRIKILLFKFFGLLKIEKKYLPVFSLLVVLSSIFWTLTVLSKDYTATIRYDVKFVDFPDKMLQTENKDVELQLQVNAPGFTILAHRLKIMPNVNLSVSGFIPQKKGELWNYFWLGKQRLVVQVLLKNFLNFRKDLYHLKAFQYFHLHYQFLRVFY